MCGIFINAVTYVTIVIAIGLLVDFLMHILLRYYETTGATREEKVTETLETMGASMLMGGFTTWLGVIPLSLSSTKIFNTIVSLDGARVLGSLCGQTEFQTNMFGLSRHCIAVCCLYGHGHVGTLGLADTNARRVELLWTPGLYDRSTRNNPRAAPALQTRTAKDRHSRPRQYQGWRPVERRRERKQHRLWQRSPRFVALASTPSS